MATIGEQLQLGRRMATTLASSRASVLNAWLRRLRDIPRDFGGRIPEAHLEEFASPTLDAAIAYLARGDRKALRGVARSWAGRLDGMGVGLGEVVRAVLLLGPAAAPTLRAAGLGGGQGQLEGFLAALAEELSRARDVALKRRIAETATAFGAAEARLLSLQAVAGAIAQERDQERTLELIARQVLKLTGAEGCAVYLPDDDDQSLRPTVRIGPDGIERGGRAEPIAGGALGHAYRSGHLLVAGDAAGNGGGLARSTVTAPLRIRQGIIGVIRVEKDGGEGFARDVVELLGLFADQAAVALENARLMEAERRRRQELGSILDVTTAATQSLLLDEVLRRVARGIADAVDMPSCGVYLLDDDGRWLLPAAAVGDHLPAESAGGGATSRYAQPIDTDGDAFLREALAGRGATVCADVSTDARTAASALCALGARSMLAAPLIAQDRPLGVVLVAAFDAPCDFSPAQLRLIEGIAGSAALAVENARLYAHSRELATAEERNRLAREIHDGLAQGLTAVTLHLEVADAALETTAAPDEVRERVRTALRLTRANLDDARRSVVDLRVAPLQELTLPQALEELVASAAREGGFEGCYRSRGFAGDAGRLPARLEAGFYRIAQELLSNVRKHAHATQVDVRLERRDDVLTLAVTDDGQGFDPATPATPGARGGFGLIGLRERVALLGGTIHFDSAPDEGTHVRVSAPLRSDERGRPLGRTSDEQGGRNVQPS